MAGCQRQWKWAIGVVGVILVGILSGCGKEPSSQNPPEGSANPASYESQQGPPVDLDPRLHQPFAEATTTEPPEDWQRPPDTTMTGKSVGKLFTEVTRLWDEIKFVSPSGKPLAYSATLETELGTIEIALRPDLAPNHVRNFVALVKAGYYDGLVFERTVHEEGENGNMELIEAGCPLGTGDVGYGSIGYWLKPEIDPQAVHEEGTLGAVRSRTEEEDGHHSEDTAACKFYITLCKAPFMDGQTTIFGKVTQGLDVARKILSLPVRDDGEYPDGDRPVKPVVIRRVTIHATEVENLAQNGDNK
jgi:cyclophilin family peptidyl-prolyl cis-trans isomerase